MQVSGVNNYSTAGSIASSSTANTDKKFQQILAGGSSNDPAAMLSQMTSNGISGMWAWQVDQIKQQVMQQIMGAQNLTPQQIAAMPDTQRAQVEQTIMKAVEQRVKELIQQDMQKHKQDALGAGLSGGADPTSAGVGTTLNIAV